VGVDKGCGWCGSPSPVAKSHPPLPHHGCTHNISPTVHRSHCTQPPLPSKSRQVAYKMVHEPRRHRPKSRRRHLSRRHSYPPNPPFRRKEANEGVYFGAGVAYMFWQSRQNKGELRKRLIEVPLFPVRALNRRPVSSILTGNNSCTVSRAKTHGSAKSASPNAKTSKSELKTKRPPKKLPMQKLWKSD
jgi:hypothetical protein